MQFCLYTRSPASGSAFDSLARWPSTWPTHNVALATPMIVIIPARRITRSPHSRQTCQTAASILHSPKACNPGFSKIASAALHCYNASCDATIGECLTVQFPTSLLKTFNTTLNDLGADMALVALKEDGFGPYQSPANRGFSPREVQAIVKTLSHPEVGFDTAGNGGSKSKTVRIRMTAPSHRSLLGIPLQFSRRVCGALVIGRKDITTFSEKDRRHLTETAEELEAALA